jgi:phosphoribosylaminoimidazole carboxylase (NCAIR synthetase)
VRPNRKVGHVTLRCETEASLQKQLQQLRNLMLINNPEL